MRYLVYLQSILLAIACLYACSGGTGEPGNKLPMREGYWKLDFQTSRGSIPVRLHVRNDSLFVYNGNEIIPTTIIPDGVDSFYFELPVFQSVVKAYLQDSLSMQGSWTPPGRPDSLKIAFQAQWDGLEDRGALPQDLQSYAVTFSPETEDEYPAIGLFTAMQGRAYGTFLTETGDYRYLEGERKGDSLWLSCFDGAHLFHFRAAFSNSDSSVQGTFQSGKSWFEPWIGIADADPQLSHPDSITLFTAEPRTSLEFEATDRQGNKRVFGADDWKGKITIVQLMGSWCPNCMDESRYFRKLVQTAGPDEIQLIPIAFERTGSLEQRVKALESFEKALGLGPISYIGGLASKAEASSVFYQLSGISSFPTSIFIDKKGVVRKIHTGFYGPGTGKYYTRYTESTESFIRQLLSETE